MPFLSMVLFAAALSLAPGPVNLIILSTGVSHGARAALRFVIGATVGFTALLVLTGLGLSATRAFPEWVVDVISCLGALVICYFGIQLVRARGDFATQEVPIPSFWQGAALQWLNPKAWVASLSGVAMFGLQGDTWGLLQFSALYFAVCFIGIGLWAPLGELLSKGLNTPLRQRVFTTTLGLCLIILALSLSTPAVVRLLNGVS
ncbi:LysE family translocator [Thalassobius sp. Cn5-15]|uniref:LysE family translocator n=1 Tax=Thalassobius sp. Cn5-15 TaxID=2917763 RepID=UPI001EF3063D|nr:LysE family translocator [Thalassobius sp. Cn5-15]MCG7492919.1 LysE family translocator [Thalassobius sp. Cn5-15]